jgi:hypothetical protein
MMTMRTASAPSVALALSLLAATGPGCVGGRFDSRDPASDLDRPTRDLVTAIGTARAGKNLPPPTWVKELRPPAVRGALGVARGDLTLKTAAHQAAVGAVTELGRHAWSFVAECDDLSKFRPPAMALGGPTLLLGAAVVQAVPGRSIVVVVIAEPGASALRADQMGGGGGGTNPTLEAYAHPAIASGPCGESWPAATPARL